MLYKSNSRSIESPTTYEQFVKQIVNNMSANQGRFTIITIMKKVKYSPYLISREFGFEMQYKQKSKDLTVDKLFPLYVSWDVNFRFRIENETQLKQFIKQYETIETDMDKLYKIHLEFIIFYRTHIMGLDLAECKKKYYLYQTLKEYYKNIFGSFSVAKVFPTNIREPRLTLELQPDGHIIFSKTHINANTNT